VSLVGAVIEIQNRGASSEVVRAAVRV